VRTFLYLIWAVGPIFGYAGPPDWTDSHIEERTTHEDSSSQQARGGRFGDRDRRGHVGDGKGAVHAALQEGGAGRDVILGADDDNAGNTIIQPPDVQAKQHLDNTDLILGAKEDDLLIA